ncbi:MAG: LuxR C-terminal-related transcriptional regulator [Actinomycetota bacterium]|jgi:LuxR family transcriptional regulator, maltose regulon positive regulatory protein
MTKQRAGAELARLGRDRTETAERAARLGPGDEPALAPVVLLETKLQPPAHRVAFVPRPRLVALLDQGSPGQLTLVDAPAGWGKTSLLAEWHAAARDPASFAWLALDVSDNDPVRFWTYVIEALRSVAPGLGELALAALGAPGTTAIDITLPALVNDLAALDSPVVLVLDDYHLVTNPEVHEAMAFLVEHLPPTLHLVVATRHDPPFPLARLRVRRQVVEVRTDDLRFTEQETLVLANAVFGLSLDPADALRLHRRTEGWAAGLRLAAHSLRGRNDAADFISAFAGDDRHIVDYLGSEVLDAQPPALRRFLLRTSILERLSGPLCDAVLASSGSARMLEVIDRNNLFLVPLDNRRQWYRYHHLFAELLRHELGRSDPELVPELHRRASAWCRQAGLISEGIHHAIAAGAFDEAGEQIARHWLITVDQGRQHTVMAWLDALPHATVEGDARLCLARAMTLLSVGRPNEADRWIATATRAEAAGPLWDGMSSVESGVAFARSMEGALAGDLVEAADAALRALELERQGPTPFWRVALGAIVGSVLYLAGRADEAAGYLDESLAAEAGANGMGLAYGLGFRSLLHAEDGDLAAAEDALVRAGRLLGDHPALAEHFAWYAVHVATAYLHEHRDRLVEAAKELERATTLARRGGGPAQISFCLIAWGRVRLALGERTAAADAAHEARQLLATCRNPGTLLPARLDMLECALRRRHVGQPPPSPFDHAPARRSLVQELSDRELDVLRLLAGPLSIREIGAALYVSHNTVKTHARGIYRKLGVNNREEAVARARDLGLD